MPPLQPAAKTKNKMKQLVSILACSEKKKSTTTRKSKTKPPGVQI